MTKDGAQSVLIAVQEAALSLAKTAFTDYSDESRGQDVNTIVESMNSAVDKRIALDTPPPAPVADAVGPSGDPPMGGDSSPE